MHASIQQAHVFGGDRVWDWGSIATFFFLSEECLISHFKAISNVSMNFFNSKFLGYGLVFSISTGPFWLLRSRC